MNNQQRLLEEDLFFRINKWLNGYKKIIRNYSDHDIYSVLNFEMMIDWFLNISH